MPDPTWLATGAGSPAVNGLYIEEGDRCGRPMYRHAVEDPEIWICWDTDTRWYWCPNPAAPAYLPYYFTDAQAWDLPDVTWNKGSGGELPLPVLTSAPTPPRPSAVNLLCDGKQEPIGLLNPTPTLSWTFVAADGGPGQTAYQIQVATTRALLVAHTPDLWDSGVILTSVEGAIYIGAALPQLETHWWAVAVRDANGLWSEDW